MLHKRLLLERHERKALIRQGRIYILLPNFNLQEVRLQYILPTKFGKNTTFILVYKIPLYLMKIRLFQENPQKCGISLNLRLLP